MESRIIKKKMMVKGSLMASKIKEEDFPIDVLELVFTTSQMDSKWSKINKLYIDTLQDKILEIPKKKFYKNIEFAVRTIEIDEVENINEILTTFRFIFTGRIKKSDAEEIGGQFNSICKGEFGGDVKVKLNLMDKIEMMVCIVPLQLVYDPYRIVKSKFLTEEFFNEFFEYPMLTLPQSFFTNQLHLDEKTPNK
jgi:hypothetical protein